MEKRGKLLKAMLEQFLKDGTKAFTPSDYELREVLRLFETSRDRTGAFVVLEGLGYLKKLRYNSYELTKKALNLLKPSEVITI